MTKRGIFHVKVTMVSHRTVVACIPSILLSVLLTSNAVGAVGSDPAVSLMPAYAGTRFMTVADKNEFAAGRSDAGASTWDWRLSGVVIGSDLRIAFFAQVGKTRAVTEGQVIDGWMVTSVGRDGVTLSAAGQIRVVHLEGMSEDEAAEAAQRRADEIERVNAPVLAASRQQDIEREEAMRDLAEATRQMTAQ